MPRLFCKSFGPWHDRLPPLTQGVLTVTAQALLPKVINLLCYWSKINKSSAGMLWEWMTKQKIEEAVSKGKSLKTTAMCPTEVPMSNTVASSYLLTHGKVTPSARDYAAT